MKQAAIGFRVHSGWSAVVALCLEKGAPVVVHRQRVHLVETFGYRFRQPYHTAARMGIAEGREFISSVSAKARDLAYRAIGSVSEKLKERKCELSCCALLLSSGRQLPELEKILASHAMIHTADGALFRESLLHASERCGLAVLCVKDRDLLRQASSVFRLSQPKILARATEMGRVLGPPWSQDEKFAALAAWLALSEGRDSAQRAPIDKRR
jgi:hypothetical protein